MRDYFNYPDITCEITAGSGRSDRFLMCLPDSFVMQKVEKVTRRTAIMDFILTNRDKMVESRSYRNFGGKQSYHTLNHHNATTGS